MTYLCSNCNLVLMSHIGFVHVLEMNPEMEDDK